MNFLDNRYGRLQTASTPQSIDSNAHREIDIEVQTGVIVRIKFIKTMIMILIIIILILLLIIILLMCSNNDNETINNNDNNIITHNNNNINM